MYAIDPALEAAYLEALLTSHAIRVRIDVLDREENTIGTIPLPLLDGNVQVDSDADVSRALNFSVLDPKNTLKFDATSAAQGAFYASNFLRCWYGVRVADGTWVDIPVFTGPVTGISRSGAVVTVEAHSKESLGLDPCLSVAAYSLPYGMRIRDAIMNVMGRIGERKFALQMVGGTDEVGLAPPINFGRSVLPNDEPWAVCKGGGQKGDDEQGPPLITFAQPPMYLFYDAMGILTAKQKSMPDQWVFDGQQILSQPTLSYDALSFRNYAEVSSTAADGSQQVLRGSYVLPPSHPLSPQSLSRNGVPRFLAIIEDNGNLDSDYACRVRAQALVEDTLLDELDVAFPCLPIPHLEPDDVVRMNFGGWNLQFRIKTFTLPLTSDQSMEIGAARRVQLSRAAVPAPPPPPPQGVRTAKEVAHTYRDKLKNVRKTGPKKGGHAKPSKHRKKGH